MAATHPGCLVSLDKTGTIIALSGRERRRPMPLEDTPTEKVLQAAKRCMNLIAQMQFRGEPKRDLANAQSVLREVARVAMAGASHAKEGLDECP
jgi:hypothetical protein